MNTRRWPYLLLGLLALYAIYTIGTRFLSTDVIAARVVRDTAIKAVSGTITVRPLVETKILSSGNGFLLESHLKEGGQITKGQTLAQIDPADLPFQIQGAEIQLNTLQQELERGSPEAITLQAREHELEQSKDLLEAGFMPQSDYDKLVETIEVLRHRIAADKDSLLSRIEIQQNQLDELKDKLSRLTIVAPMDSTVAEVQAFPGDLLSVGTPLARIISKNVKIAAEVNQDDIDAIRVGTRANIRFFAYGNTLFEAKVTKILPSSDPNTQRFSIYLEMLTPTDKMLPGMTGEASFLADEHEHALVIPRQALLGDHVFVVDGSHLERRKVSTGYLSYSDAEILDGLEEGEVVVVEDVDLFRSGDNVRIAHILGE